MKRNENTYFIELEFANKIFNIIAKLNDKERLWLQLFKRAVEQ